MHILRQLKKITARLETGIKLESSHKMKASIGTAFLIDRDLVLTCAHCVEGKSQVQLTFPYWKTNPSIRTAQVELTDSQKDFAFLRLNKPALESIPLLPLHQSAYLDASWSTYAYPQISKELLGGLKLKGTLQDLEADPYQDGRRLLQLKYDGNDLLEGASGAPLVVGKVLVGMLSTQIKANNILKGKEGVLQTIYALPLSEISFPKNIKVLPALNSPKPKDSIHAPQAILTESSDVDEIDQRRKKSGTQDIKVISSTVGKISQSQ